MNNFINFFSKKIPEEAFAVRTEWLYSTPFGFQYVTIEIENLYRTPGPVTSFRTYVNEPYNNICNFSHDTIDVGIERLTSHYFKLHNNLMKRVYQ